MIEPTALKLLGAIAQTPGALITAAALEHIPPRLPRQLTKAGLIVPRGHQSSTVSLVDHADTPVRLVRSPIDGRFGYFSPVSGWVPVALDRIGTFALDIGAVAARVVARLEGRWLPDPAIITPDAIWELGTARLPGRAQRISVWFAPRLIGETGRGVIVEAKRRRPAPGLRIVLTFTPEGAIPTNFIDGHQVVSIPSVIDFEDGLAVDPEVLASRLSGSAPDDRPLVAAADGGRVMLHGRKFTFTGSKQKWIIRTLWAAFEAGEPECVTAHVLTEAGCADSVNTIAKAFGSRTDWREFITERDGLCWMHS